MELKGWNWIWNVEERDGWKRWNNKTWSHIKEKNWDGAVQGRGYIGLVEKSYVK
jgi:hypothetical protein